MEVVEMTTNPLTTESPLSREDPPARRTPSSGMHSPLKGHPQITENPLLMENPLPPAPAKRLPHSTLEKWSERLMPNKVHKLLFGPVSEFWLCRWFIQFAFAAITGTGLSFGIVYNFPVNTLYKIIIGLCFGVPFTIFATFSAYLRCSALLMLPNMVGSWGRTFLLVLIMNCLTEGPISNIQRNVNEVVFSMGCNMDLQITQSKLMWRMVTEPYIEVLQELVYDSVELQNEAQNVSREFQSIRDEVMGQYGYDSVGKKPEAPGSNTQEQFTLKTRMRYMVKEGIGRCQDWFTDKLDNCMESIKYPVISHLLCLPMKFTFLCNIMKVMTPWCKDSVPVEGNFGQTFDRLNSSITKLGEQFTANIAIEKWDQDSVYGVKHFHEEFKKELIQSFQEKRDIIMEIKMILEIILSLSFISIFISAFYYAWKYSSDIRFDNVYITTYFKLIDDRRKRQGRHFLLPIDKAEKCGFVEPCRKKIHSSELQLVATGLVQVFLLALFACVLLSTDAVLFKVFTIIGKHTYTNFSLTSRQEVHIDIAGESMLARILRKTIGAFNKSSNIDIESTNKDCLPKPNALVSADYVSCVFPVLLMLLLCILQVYVNRLRRVIMAFYFPKREKRRVLFLYNLHLQRHRTYVQIEGQRLREQGFPNKMVWSMLQSILKCCFKKGMDRCWICEKWMSVRNIINCPSESCNAVYCRQCWAVQSRCSACPQAKRTDSYDSDSNIDVYYAS